MEIWVFSRILGQKLKEQDWALDARLSDMTARVTEFKGVDAYFHGVIS